jgi:hypothetical protein
VEGRDYGVENRYADGDASRLPLLAEELVRLKPDVIVASTTNGAMATKQATASTPIVGVNLTDPVGFGLIASEAHPGTNVTGILFRLEGLTAKQVELALDLMPDIDGGRYATAGRPAPRLVAFIARRHRVSVRKPDQAHALIAIEYHPRRRVCCGYEASLRHAAQQDVFAARNKPRLLRDLIFHASVALRVSSGSRRKSVPLSSSRSKA